MECKSIGCTSSAAVGDDFCEACLGRNRGGAVPIPALDGIIPKAHAMWSLPRETGAARSVDGAKSSGGDNDYWVLRIDDPKRLEPYTVECEDIIEAMQMTFQEGEAFKALWRKGKARIGEGKPDDTPLRNAEKVAHFGARMVAMEKRRLQEA